MKIRPSPFFKGYSGMTLGQNLNQLIIKPTSLSDEKTNFAYASTPYGLFIRPGPAL
jgi:hypothetical protein